LACKSIADQQVRLSTSDLHKHTQRTAAARAGFSERMARRFDADPTPPSNRKTVHGRTVTDPLEGYWEDDLLPLLEKDGALQAVTLLRHLQGLRPLAFSDDRVRRTLERRVRRWRALNGPERDIIFRQTPEPGRIAQSDFTHAVELGVVNRLRILPPDRRPNLTPGGLAVGVIYTRRLHRGRGPEAWSPQVAQRLRAPPSRSDAQWSAAWTYMTQGRWRIFRPISTPSRRAGGWTGSTRSISGPKRLTRRGGAR